MKKLILILLAALLIMSFISCDKADNDGAELNYNNFTVYDNESNEIALSDIVNEGKPVVINFWTTWCPYCINEMPEFEEVYTEYDGKVNFMMIDVDGGGNDDINKAKQYIADEGYTFPVYFDSALYAAQAYNIGSFPTTVIIDARGNEIYNRSGSLSKEALISFIDGAF